jgi:ABC-type branched-subunit amino acid transport system substrate-binding protein
MFAADLRAAGRLVPLVLAGCSLSRFDYVPCTDGAECRDAFGLGWTCGGEGYCDQVPMNPRCSLTWPEDLLVRPEDYPGIIVVGMMADNTQDYSEVQAARLPFVQADDQGALGGQQVGLVMCTYEELTSLDGMDNEEATVDVGTWLVDAVGAPAIIGPITSALTTTLYSEVVAAQAKEVLIVSPSATSPALTYLDGYTKTDENPGLLWRTCPPDTVQGAAAAQDMIGRGVERVAIIFQTGPYGAGLQEAFLEGFTGGSRSTEIFEFDSETARDVATAAVAEANDFDEVFFISAEVTDIIDFLNYLTAYPTFDEANTGIFLADGAADIQLVEETTGATQFYDQVRGSRPSVPASTLYDSFAGSYFSEYGTEATDSIYTAYAYDAGWLSLYALAWSVSQEGGASPIGMARGLRRVSSGIEVEIRPTGWSTVQAAFGEGQGIDVVGVSGSLDYDPTTEETTAPIEIWVINADRTGFDTVATIEPD